MNRLSPPVTGVGRERWKAFLAPGLAVKRWLGFLGLGVCISGFGLALFLRQLHFPPSLPGLVRSLTLPFLPDWLRGGLLIGLGLLVAAFGVWQMNQQVAALFLDRDNSLDARELVAELAVRQQQRQRRSGPKVVVIGGGTGMPGVLRALRPYTENITAVVTVADDGGSSGALRRSIGILPPGDFRNNIAALSDAEELMTQLMQYRFGESDALGSHNFGNIFIAAMAAITGSFETGLAESSRVLAVRGRILPSTLDNVMLCAEVRRTLGLAAGTGADPAQEEWVFVRGESRIPESGGEIVRVFLEPDDCRAYPATVQAILNADLILAAPGSFFTSLMPNLLVPRIREAIVASDAVRLYICNVMTQPGETDGFDVAAHMRHLRLHAGDAFSAVLANDTFASAGADTSPRAVRQSWVALPPADAALPFRLFTGDVLDESRPSTHNPQKLGKRVMEIYHSLRQEQEIGIP